MQHAREAQWCSAGNFSEELTLSRYFYLVVKFFSDLASSDERCSKIANHGGWWHGDSIMLLPALCTGARGSACACNGTDNLDVVCRGDMKLQFDAR